MLADAAEIAEQGAPDSGAGSAVDQVVDSLRTLIREGGLSVGDVLPSEVDLAARLGSSRNTVREAIRILKAYGVVESRQKVGAVLTDRRQAAIMDAFSFAIDLSAETFRDVQGFRRLIEMNLGEIIVGKIPADTLADMAGFNDQMALATDPLQAAQLDYAFHKALIDAAGNRTLSEMYAMLKPVVQRVMETGKTERRALDAASTEHAAILEALHAKDRLAFAYHMSRHLDAGLEFIPPERPARAHGTKTIKRPGKGPSRTAAKQAAAKRAPLRAGAAPGIDTDEI